MPDARSEISRAVAKAFAYKAAGKDVTASEWADKAVELLNTTFPSSPFGKRPKRTPPLSPKK